MARKMKAAEGEARGEVDKETGRIVLPNTAAREQRIRDGFQAIYAQRRKIEDLMAKHIQKHKDELKEMWRTLKADTDIDRKDLDLEFKLYEREQLAKGMEEDDRARILDNMKVVFNALRVGEMVDFISMMEGSPSEALH